MSVFPNGTLTLNGPIGNASNPLSVNGSGHVTVNGTVGGAGSVVMRGLGTSE